MGIGIDLDKIRSLLLTSIVNLYALLKILCWVVGSESDETNFVTIRLEHLIAACNARIKYYRRKPGRINGSRRKIRQRANVQGRSLVSPLSSKKTTLAVQHTQQQGPHLNFSPSKFEKYDRNYRRRRAFKQLSTTNSWMSPAGRVNSYVSSFYAVC